VRVVSGIFQHKLAIYQGMNSKSRVEVLMAVLGGQQRVRCDRAYLAQLSSRSSKYASGPSLLSSQARASGTNSGLK
jgi:hypothetical protein